jgi:hypothetical protein
VEIALHLADWLARRWWGKPFAWLIRGVLVLIAGVAAVLFAVLALSVVVGVLGGIGYAIASANPVSASLFSAAAGLLLAAAFGVWRAFVAEDAERDSRASAWWVTTGGSTVVAVVVAIAWVISIPGGEETARGGGGSAQCDPSYEGECLDPDASDYDCTGGTGNGPEYVGFVEVVGSDPYGLDADGDGFGCE